MYRYSKYYDIKHVYSNEYLNIYYCENPGFIAADWSGILDANRAKEGCLQILEHVKKYPVTKILNNNQHVTGHYPGAIDWVGKIWFPSLFDEGVLYFAWVYSPEFYTQVGTDAIIALSSKVTIKTFFDIVTAMDWLLMQPAEV